MPYYDDSSFCLSTIILILPHLMFITFVAWLKIYRFLLGVFVMPFAHIPWDYFKRCLLRFLTCLPLSSFLTFQTSFLIHRNLITRSKQLQYISFISSWSFSFHLKTSSNIHFIRTVAAMSEERRHLSLGKMIFLYTILFAYNIITFSMYGSKAY